MSWGCSVKCVRFSDKDGQNLEVQMTPAQLLFSSVSVNTIFALKVEDLDPENLVTLKLLINGQKPVKKEFLKVCMFWSAYRF